MKMYYEIPYEINKGSFNIFEIAIFSSEYYNNENYTYEADFNCVDMSLLENKECAQNIADYFNIHFDLADRLMSGHEEDLEVELSKDFNVIGCLLHIRGECAVKMGYDGYIEEDCCGDTTYVVLMKGREKELTLVTEQ